MQYRSSKKRMHLDITPMIDVIFLLLIFFMSVSVFKEKESILSIVLPISESAAFVKKDKKVVSFELSEEQFAVDGTELQLSSVDSLLQIFKESENSFEIRIDKDTRYERVAFLLEQMSLYGIEVSDLILQKQ